METLKTMTTDIFAPYKIAKQLEELEFNEPCIAAYSEKYADHYEGPTLIGELYLYYYAGDTQNENVLGELEYVEKGYDSDIPVPTWEQVFKWFREKGYHSYILQSDETLEYWGEIEGKSSSWSGNFTKIYEQCREALALKLIELYKKEQQ